MNFDCIVIGGGPAGMMAAISAAEQGGRVLLLEKGPVLGRKLLVTGGGRCNVTSRLPLDTLIQNIPGNGRFLYSALSTFNNEDIITFFKKAGVPLKEEDRGRMFPVTDQASTVVDGFIGQLKKHRVTVQTKAAVASVLYGDGAVEGVILQSGEKVKSPNVVIAVGGQTMPKTGSSGDGYAWAKEAGHTIVPLYPTEVPLVSKETFITNRGLQGISFEDVELTLINQKGKKVISHRHDLLFTHFGLSGPAALRMSQFVRKLKDKEGRSEVTVLLDVLPNDSEGSLMEWLQGAQRKEGLKHLVTVLKSRLQTRYAEFLIERLGLNGSAAIDTFKKDDLMKLVQSMKALPIQVTGTKGFDQAFVTGGGVSVKEINPKTMESKLMNGLFFCGEVLDVHAYTGGFNITAAMVTGRIAGVNAVQK